MKPEYKAFFLAEDTSSGTRYMAEFNITENNTNLHLRYASGTIECMVEAIQEELPILIAGPKQKRIKVGLLEGRIKITNLDGFSTLRPLTKKETVRLRKEFRRAKVTSYLKMI